MKKFLAVLMCCLVLCTSVFADLEDSAPSDSSDSAPSDSSDSVTAGGEADEAPVSIPEKVDEIVDNVSSLVDETIPEAPSGESDAEVSPGGNTIYVVGGLDEPEKEYIYDAGIDAPDAVITDISILSSVAPVTPSDTSGLKAILLSFLGNYDPVIVEYQYSSSQGYNNYLREVQPDYVWICSFVLLALLIFCLFKLGGALLRG